MFAAPITTEDSNTDKRKSRNRTQRHKNDRVSSVIQTLRNMPPVNQYDDSTNDLVDFKPIDPPTSVGVEQTIYRDDDDSFANQSQDSSETPVSGNSNSYSSSFMNISNDQDSEIDGMIGGNETSGDSSNIVLKKINYVIKLLEEQQDEKTSNVVEEIILYFFLGIFIIFIVDSFVRMGKYTR